VSKTLQSTSTLKLQNEDAKAQWHKKAESDAGRLV
jgi:hypothetical protein